MDQQVSRIKADVMIDFETLGVVPGSVVLSLGMVAFTQDEQLFDRYEEFSLTNQIFHGRTVSRDTLDWWKETDEEEVKRLMYDGYILPQHTIPKMWDSMISRYKVGSVWSRGHMDFDMLNEFIDIPYNMSKDCRTLDIFKRMPQVNTHNALEDCENQIKHVQEVMREWNNPRVLLKTQALRRRGKLSLRKVRCS